MAGEENPSKAFQRMLLLRAGIIAAIVGAISGGISGYFAGRLPDEPKSIIAPVADEPIAVNVPPPFVAPAPPAPVAPKPAIFDANDFESTARWIVALYEPMTPHVVTMHSSVETAKARGEAERKCQAIVESIFQEMKRLGSPHVRWQARVAEIGGSGVVLEWSGQVVTGGSPLRLVVVEPFLVRPELLPAQDETDDQRERREARMESLKRTLSVGLQIGKEQIDSLKVGDAVSVEGDIRQIVPNPPSHIIGLPSGFTIYLGNPHVEGFKPPAN